MSETGPTTVAAVGPAADAPSYGQILRSSALIGAASVLDIGFRVIRVKLMAIWLGPAGVGLVGLFSSVSDLTYSVAGMGLESSGVRQIAQAMGSGDGGRIALTAQVLRRACLALGVIGGALLVLLARPVSTLTFGGDDHAGGVALLGVVVFLRLVYGGRAALLRGLRRIGDLARMEVIGAFLGTLATIPLIYVWREDGVVPSLLAAAAAMALGSWWYARRVVHAQPDPVATGAQRELGALLKLGFAFLLTGLLTMGVAYAVRVIVLRQLGVEAAGHYQSAWTIGGLYVGFILQAMGTDFYPRLTAIADDAIASNRVVNEQVLVSLLLAGPGVLATLTFTPLIITIFYSAHFEEAVGALRWICLGMSLRVIAWPLGFIVVAKGLQALFVWIDLACAIVHLGLAWLLVPVVGLDGAGMAFFGLYVFYAAIIYPIARRITGFRWSPVNRRLGLLFVPLIGLVFAGFHVLPSRASTAVGLLAVLLSSAVSLRLLTVLASDSLPRPLRRLLERIPLLRPGPAS